MYVYLNVYHVCVDDCFWCVALTAEHLDVPLTSSLTILPVGDVNGDGYDDMLLGTPTVYANSGQSYLMYGAASYSANIHLDALTSAQGMKFVDATNPNAYSGFSVSYAGMSW